MKLLLVICLCLGTAFADTSKWLDFRVRFSPLATGIGETAFFPIEKELDKAILAGWVQSEWNPNDHIGTTVCLSPTDVRVCPMYDLNGFIAGLHLAFPCSDVEGKDIPYDFEKFPVYQKKSFNDVLYWTSTFYIVDPEEISAGGRPSAPTFGNGLWIKSGNGFTEVPTDLESIKSSTAYTWQNCIPAMGIHYYYNITSEFDCNDMQPFFLMVKEGNMIGIGWQVIGTTQYEERNWYEKITGQAVHAAVPLAPPCLAERADKYGVISIHMYFVEEPWTITCDQDTESVVPLPN